MNKENRIDKKMIPESQEEMRRSKKNKTTIKQVLVDWDSENEMIEVVNNQNNLPIVNFTPRKYFQKLSLNLHGYMTIYFTIEDMFKFLKLNRKFRKAILEISKILIKFILLRKLEKSHLSSKIEICGSNGESLNRLIRIVKMDELTIKEKDYVIQTFICNLNKLSQLTFTDPSIYVIDHVKIIMTSYNCQVTSLIIKLEKFSNRIQLNDFKTISDNLTDIVLRNKSMTSFSLSVPNAEQFMPIFHALSENITIKEVNFSLIFSTKEFFKTLSPKMFENLKKNKSIEKMTLEINAKMDEESEENNLNDFIETNTKLKELKLVNMYYSKQNYKGLMKAIKRNCSLEVLWLQGKLKRTELNYLAKALYQPANPNPKDIFNNKIHTLILNENKFDHENYFMYIGDIVVHNKTITKLDLSENSMIKSRSFFLMDALQTNTTLKTLVFRDCSLEQEGLGMLLNVLKDNTTLTEIEVSNNKIPICIKSILEMLDTNNTLKICNFNNNFYTSGHNLLEIFMEKIAERIIQN